VPIYQKINGVWTQAQRPYLHKGDPGQSGVWSALSAAYVKRSGVWVQAYEYDVDPPNPPEVTLSIYEDWNGNKLHTRWIYVGVRLPGASNDPDARLSRVLTTYAGKPPTTQFGGTWTPGSDSSYPSEPWSEWRYNAFGVHKDTSVYIYKQWPRNAQPGTIIAGNRHYHFGAWSLDNNGNWSAPVQAQIWVPKASVNAPNIVVKEAKFQPVYSGSWTTSGFKPGSLVQQNSPRSTGLWFYGNQITDSFGAQTTRGESITVKTAQIYIKRENDNGAADANIYLFWTPYAWISSLPAAGASIVREEPIKLGTLAKGQGKWFDLPTSYRNNLNHDIKGLGLSYKDPAKAAAFPEDYSSVVGTEVNLRVGELNIVWQEEL
jgi:hypothetical protein